MNPEVMNPEVVVPEIPCFMKIPAEHFCLFAKVSAEGFLIPITLLGRIGCVSQWLHEQIAPRLAHCLRERTRLSRLLAPWLYRKCVNYPVVFPHKMMKIIPAADIQFRGNKILFLDDGAIFSVKQRKYTVALTNMSFITTEPVPFIMRLYVEGVCVIVCEAHTSDYIDLNKRFPSRANHIVRLYGDDPHYWPGRYLINMKMLTMYNPLPMHGILSNAYITVKRPPVLDIYGNEIDPVISQIVDRITGRSRGGIVFFADYFRRMILHFACANYNSEVVAAMERCVLNYREFHPDNAFQSFLIPKCMSDEFDGVACIWPQNRKLIADDLLG